MCNVLGQLSEYQNYFIVTNITIIFHFLIHPLEILAQASCNAQLDKYIKTFVDLGYLMFPEKNKISIK